MSFTYNVGENWMDLESGFETMNKGLKTGDIKTIQKAFPLYVKGEDQTTGELITVDGLVNRRAKELKLFNTPVEAIRKPKSKYDKYIKERYEFD